MDNFTIPTPKQLNKEYSAIIGRNLKKIIDSSEYTQNGLVDKLKDLGVQINQGTLSKIINGKADIQLSVVIKLCDILKISISDLSSENFQYHVSSASADSLESEKRTDKFSSKAESKFITDPENQNFRGYLQKYYCYFYPTLSGENELLSGELELHPNGSYCHASFKLNTNKQINGKPIYKIYTGCAIISTSVDSCYVLLISSEEGELCLINFRHFYIRHQFLDCRMAEVITNGAGDQHYPTIHRMLLSRAPIKKEHLTLISPHLHLNNSTIQINADSLNNLSNESPQYSTLVEHLTHKIKCTSMYSFKENYVVSNAEQLLSKDEARIFLLKLRDNAFKVRYNKISNKVDESVRKTLRALGYYEDSSFF